MDMEELLKTSFERGKQGIKGEHKSKIHGNIQSSLDFDETFNQGNDNAWDYLLRVNGSYPFIEIHPAKSGGNLNEMIAKLTWLKNWITRPEIIDEIKKERSRLIWLHTAGFDIKETPQGKRRILAEHKILYPPQGHVDLDKIEYYTVKQIFKLQ